MRRGRQEDAHEFLRYSVDALQRSCLAGHPPYVAITDILRIAGDSLAGSLTLG